MLLRLLFTAGVVSNSDDDEGGEEEKEEEEEEEEEEDDDEDEDVNDAGTTCSPVHHCLKKSLCPSSLLQHSNNCDGSFTFQGWRSGTLMLSCPTELANSKRFTFPFNSHRNKCNCCKTVT